MPLVIVVEYRLEGLVSTKCDVYCFGILLMETSTRRKPSNEIFDGDFTLRPRISDSLPNSLIWIVDAKLLRFESMIDIPDNNLEMLENMYLSGKFKCAKSIMKLALNCSMEPLGENINDVVVALQKIKYQLLTYFVN